MAAARSLAPAAARPGVASRQFGSGQSSGPRRCSFAAAVAHEAPQLRTRWAQATLSSRGRGSRRLPLPVHVSADMRATGDSAGEYSPSAPFYKVEAVLRPWRIKFVCRMVPFRVPVPTCIGPEMRQEDLPLQDVLSALIEQGIRGVTVADVRGFGAQGGSRERQAGSEFSDDSLVLKAKLEVVIIADQVEDVIETIIREARTGEIGDGKIFISPIAEVVRVRTGERGVEAERMAGGRQELLGKDHIYTTVDGREML